MQRQILFSLLLGLSTFCFGQKLYLDQTEQDIKRQLHQTVIKKSYWSKPLDMIYDLKWIDVDNQLEYIVSFNSENSKPSITTIRILDINSVSKWISSLNEKYIIVDVNKKWKKHLSLDKILVIKLSHNNERTAYVITASYESQ